MNMNLTSLNESTLLEAVDQLCQKDSALRSVVDRWGSPPLWAREPGFSTLIHIILEQQVSLASAKACFDKLNAVLPGLDPDGFLTLSDEALLKIGFSRQKTRYSRMLAQAILEGTLDLQALNHASNEAVFEALTALKGIGPWTANIYLLMALGRVDIWPEGDLALVVALQKLYNLDHRPDRTEFLAMGEDWRPYRAVAARILWHYYLSR